MDNVWKHLYNNFDSYMGISLFFPIFGPIITGVLFNDVASGFLIGIMFTFCMFLWLDQSTKEMSKKKKRNKY